MTKRPGIAGRIGEFAHALTISDIPAHVIKLLPSFVLDQLACQSVGGLFGHMAIIRDYAIEESSAGLATIIGDHRGGRPEWAALANATAGHGFEMDDTHGRALAHPGCVVVPATLAVAEEVDAKGREVLVALALGFEIALRVGLVVQPSMLDTRGFHETCMMGVFGASVAAGRLIGLAPNGFAHALGIAGSHASGTIEYGRSGGEVKRLHAGLGAMGGVRSARLAGLGLTGPSRIFEGEKGIFQAFAAQPNVDAMLADLGTVWHLDQLFPKQYCAAATIHGPIRAVLELMHSHRLEADDIDRIVVGVDTFSAGHLGSLGAEPTTLAEAQFSLHYSLAMTAVLGGNDYCHYRHMAAQGFSDPEIARLAACVIVETDAEATAAFPLRFIGRVRLHCRDGREFTALGEALSHWDDAFVRTRFDTVLGDLFGVDAARTVGKGVMDFLDDGPVRGVLAPLAANATSGAPMLAEA